MPQDIHRLKPRIHHRRCCGLDIEIKLDFKKAFKKIEVWSRLTQYPNHREDPQFLHIL